MDWCHAVVDRIVDETHAVLLVGPDETEVITSRDLLPAGAHEGSPVQVRFDQGHVVAIKPDTRTQVETTQRIANKMDLLRQRGRDQTR